MQLFFRYEHVRPFQKQLMEDIYEAVSNRQNFMAQAPTGLGKTDASISAALTYAVENKLNVFFLTPKISQHKIAMDVVKGIVARHSLDARAVDTVGRSHCCIDDSLAELDGESFQTACARKRQKGQCQFYCNVRPNNRLEEVRAELRFKKMLDEYGSGKHYYELVKLGRQKMCCPYEWSLKLSEVSDVIVADYYHLLVPQIRDIFLAKIKKRVEDSIIIVDEAHNLAQRLRSSLSRKISSFTIARVCKEMRHIGVDPGPLESEFLNWASRMLGPKKERVVHCEDFNAFMSSFGLTLEDIAKNLENSGYLFVEKTGKKSACLRFLHFLDQWGDDAEDIRSVRILKSGGDGMHFYLSKILLDPSSASSILNNCASSILMSGTLLPLEMHRDILGLDQRRTIMKEYPSHFDKNGTINIVTDNLTTRYSKRDDENYSAMASKIDLIVSRTPGGTAVFFPSYKVMDSVLPRLLSKNLHIQKPSMQPSEVRTMLKDFKNGGVLCGVQGGSLSEGVDYSDGEIKTVIVVGVGLEEMNIETRAIIDYYDQKFGRGWDYGYLYPGTLKALQAAGRARRKDSDRASIVYMDERFKWGKYNWILNKGEPLIVTDKPEDEVARFWNAEK